MVIEDEGRLTNFTLRENFFMRIFATAVFRKTTATGKMRDLVDYHSKYKLLLLAHDEKKMRELGKLVANEGGRPTSAIIEDYRGILMNTFANPPSEGEHVNVLLHAFGYFKNQLSKEEKSYFLDVLNNYRQGKIPLSVPIGIVNSYIIRFGEPYLAQQAHFTPYPLDLVGKVIRAKGANYNCFATDLFPRPNGLRWSSSPDAPVSNPFDI